MGEFQKRLKAAMEMRNMKAVDLSQKSGVGKSDISNYLRGAYNAKQDKILLLAQALEVDPGWLSATETNISARVTALPKVFESLVDLAGFNEALDEDANVTIYNEHITVNQTPELIERVMKQVIAYFTFLLSQEQ